MKTVPWYNDGDAADTASVARRRREDIFGTSGDDRLTGTAAGDNFLIYQGGSDQVRGLGGNDRFSMRDTLDLTDRLNGGDGRDVVFVAGSADSTAYIITVDMLRNIENLNLVASGDNADYKLQLENGLGDLRVNAGTADSLDLDASRLTTGALNVRGASTGSNVLRGGEKGDHFTGGFLADEFTGGGGHDRFLYPSTSGSNERFGVDLITDFDKGDFIKLPVIDGGYHIASVYDGLGSVIVSYNDGGNLTSLKAFVDADQSADLIIDLLGSFTGFKVEDLYHVVIGS